MSQYTINYEALVYNFPECGSFEFLDHYFCANPVAEEVINAIIPGEDILKTNFGFQNCLLTYQDGHISYVTAKNKTPIAIDVSAEERNLQEIVQSLVEKKVEEMEQHLIFITNLHVFFPIVKINVCSADEEKHYQFGYCTNRPMPAYRWTCVAEGINLEKRLHYHIDKNAFDRFRQDKNHTRYNRAFEYYIRAFREYDHSSAFCLLCSALDAITGSSEAKVTKERLSKYSAVLFCTPLEIEQQKEKMRYFYKIRSVFTHGKGNLIKVNDEKELREYVRKFLIAYYLLWQEMGIKKEEQMLQKLDQINDNPSLYIKYAPAAYGFIRLTEEQEKRPDGIIGLPREEQKEILLTKMYEAVASNDESDCGSSGGQQDN